MSVVLLTGCSSGFGQQAALEFAQRGDTVYASMRNTAKAQALTDAATDGNVKIEVIELDVAKQASVDAAVAEVLSRSGRIDVLVNNAGVGIHGPVEECDDDEIASAFETNVFGLIRLTRAVLPHMRKQGSGTIVNVSSLAGKVAPPFGGVYAATKHAVEAISDALHYEVHPSGIRVVVVEPGGFPTEFGANRILARRFGEGSPYAALEQRFEQSLSRLPGREAPADLGDVARVIADAAHAEQPTRRYLVGNDAVAIGGLAKQMSDEDFEKTIRTALDFWD